MSLVICWELKCFMERKRLQENKVPKYVTEENETVDFGIGLGYDLSR